MTTTFLGTPKDYALRYHSDGFSILVLRNPKTGSGEKELKHRKAAAVPWDLYQIMRASKIQIERWFAKNPDYNVAIVMGNVSNNAIGFDVDGPTAVKMIEEKRLGMSTNLRVGFDNTMMNKTGSGAMHIIFRVDESIDDISQEKLWSDGRPHSQILMQGNGHYLVAAPSLHPNDNRYEWNGKTPHLITRHELNEFIRLISSEKEQQPRLEEEICYSEPYVSKTRTLTHEQMEKLLSWIKPYYIPGDRDYIIFYMSGMMRKADFSLETTRTFIKALCTESGYSDEDIDKSLTTVDRTYRRPLNELNGKSGLHELFVTSHSTTNTNEHSARAEAFSQICQIINGPPPTTLSSLPPHLPGNNLTTNSENNTLSDVKDEGKMLIIQRAENDDNSKIITYLTRQVMQSVPLRTLFDSREILYYDKREKFYRPGGDRIIDIEVERIIKEIGAPFAIRSYIKGEIQKVISDNTIAYRMQFDADPHIINLKNCLLDIMTLKQREQTSEYLTMSKLPITYDTTAECPRIEKFLGEVIQDPRKLKEVLKFWAYVLLKDCRYEKALMLLGGGSNGKSVLIKLFEEARVRACVNGLWLRCSVVCRLDCVDELPCQQVQRVTLVVERVIENRQHPSQRVLSSCRHERRSPTVPVVS
jgi:putative DNA primase/helicase